MKRLCTVKFKKIISQEIISGEFKTKNTRYNNVDFNKIIKFLINNDISFKVGIKDNVLIKNKNYIEVYGSLDIFDGYVFNENIVNHILKYQRKEK